MAYDCVHPNRPMYAKGKCNYCYHKFSRNSPATECPHTEKFAYCRNRCMACYQQWKNNRFLERQAAIKLEKSKE